MPIPLEKARTILAELQAPELAYLFAQAHARHVLYEVRELPANFPQFDPKLDDKVTFAAYGLLAAACSVAEQGERTMAALELERAASLLSYVHGPFASESRESNFHLFIAAMAFYAAGQYSRAFVNIRTVEQQTLAARAIGEFLRKDLGSLVERLNEVLLSETPSFEDQLDLDEWAITVAICRAVAITLEFTFTGGTDALDLAEAQLRDAGVIAACGNHAAWWWIVRLLRLMLKDLGEASPWTVLAPFFGPEDNAALGRYVRLLSFGRLPVMEFWTSQRAALPLVLNPLNRGAVVNLRTSAGKTRVAELAILQTLLADPGARIFYLAPFRSLALEVERTLAGIFTWLGHGVSHLYGGSRVSSVDTELAAESSIIIATPEKARALFRAEPEVFANVKLVIMDEGHLIGPSERYVRNEVFVDHLRGIVRATGARVLLLSAVLPNAQELAEWVTGDSSAVATSPWKPSAERFGLLRWNGSRVKIEWQGDVKSFNPSFVEAKCLRFGHRRKLFPANKNEAIAATAVRLSTIGPVMVFTARANSVPTLARALLLALGETPENHPWPEHEWKVFEAVCREELDPDAIELRAARAGVVCHSNRLSTQVRLAIEHLMRSKPPKVIIATTTLAQGVNVGISTVIIATPYIDARTIDKRDFWNICGRAGRAFVDGEGKIIYAIDDTRKSWQIQRDKDLARYYFESVVSEPIESGLLFAVRYIRQVATQARVSFELLLEMAANNDFSQLGDDGKACSEICELFDDELLALHIDPMVNPSSDDPAIWVEHVFRDSLAVLQARASSTDTKPEDVLAFLKARATSAIRRVPENVRRAVVASGVPLTVALRAHENLAIFSNVAGLYDTGEQTVEELANAVRTLEEWTQAHAGPITGKMPNAHKLDAIRDGWLRGVSLQKLRSDVPDVDGISRDFYGYQLPWIIHAAAQQLHTAGEHEKADTLAKIALLVEIGVPTELAARIFLAGVRSRVAATELAMLGAAFGSSVSENSRRLRSTEFTDQLRPLVTPETAEWLALMIEDTFCWCEEPLPEFRPFTVKGAEKADLLHVRKLGDQLFLTTAEGGTRIAIAPSDELPFDRMANNYRLVFQRSDGVWNFVVRDPRLEPLGEG